MLNMWVYMRYFSHFKISLKDNFLFEAKVITMYFVISNICKSK